MVEKERKPDTGGAVICESVHFFGKDDFLKTDTFSYNFDLSPKRISDIL